MQLVLRASIIPCLSQNVSNAAIEMWRRFLCSKSNSEEKEFICQDMLGLYCLAFICLYEYTVTYVLTGSEIGLHYYSGGR